MVLNIQKSTEKRKRKPEYSKAEDRKISTNYRKINFLVNSNLHIYSSPFYLAMTQCQCCGD